MRLNPFYPSDDPMSSVFYCFGGGGDDGGGGGDSRSEADRSYEDDFGFSSDIAGGFSGSAADIGGRDDNGGDNRPSPSVNPGNIGVGSGAGLGATSNANFSPGPSPGPSTGGSDPFDMDAAAKSYIDQAIANFGVGPTVGVMPDPYAEAVAAGTAVPGPDLPGFSSGFSPGEPGEVAEFNAFPSPGPITQQDYNNLQGGRSVIEQILAERAGAFPGPTNINLMDQLEDLQQGINMRQAEFDALSARYDGLAPLATFNIVPELNTQLEDLNSQLAGKQDEILGLQTRLDDTFKQFTDLQGQYGAQSDQLTALDEQFGLSQQQIQDQAARIAQQEEDARRNRILGIAGVAPVASSAMTQDDVYNLFGGPGPRTAALGSGPTVDEVVRAMNLEGEVVPGFGASIDRAIGDFMGETYGGITEQLPDGTISKELFTDLGDFVSQPTDFLSAYNPVAQQRMQEGYLADYGLEIPNIELGGQKIPMFMLGAAANAIANPKYTMTQALRQGAAPVYGTLPGQEGSILGATSPSGDIVYSNAPIGDSLAALKGTFGFGPGLDPNMEAAYARQRELDDAERARNDSNDQAAPPALTLPDPVTQECPEGYTRDGSGICVYVGQPRVGVTPYTPMAPVEFSYTGLPSLAPRTLTPTAPNLSFLNRR
jgi:hypothetical protein